MKNDWIPLTDVGMLDKIKQRSFMVPCLIFKHSTRCNISSIAQYRLNDDWDFAPTELEGYYLDLIAYRDVSHAVAEVFSVYHESPQVLVIRNGECVYDASHLDVAVDDIKSALIAVGLTAWFFYHWGFFYH